MLAVVFVMKYFQFIKTNVGAKELSDWIKYTYQHEPIRRLRFFGSRVDGCPRDNSDIDVYMEVDRVVGDSPNNTLEIIHTEFKGVHIEIHVLEYYEDYIPSYIKDYPEWLS